MREFEISVSDFVQPDQDDEVKLAKAEKQKQQNARKRALVVQN